MRVQPCLCSNDIVLPPTNRFFNVIIIPRDPRTRVFLSDRRESFVSRTIFCHRNRTRRRPFTVRTKTERPIRLLKKINTHICVLYVIILYSEYYYYCSVSDDSRATLRPSKYESDKKSDCRGEVKWKRERKKMKNKHNIFNENTRRCYCNTSRSTAPSRT